MTTPHEPTDAAADEPTVDPGRPSDTGWPTESAEPVRPAPHVASGSEGVPAPPSPDAGEEADAEPGPTAEPDPDPESEPEPESEPDPESEPEVPAASEELSVESAPVVGRDEEPELESDPDAPAYDESDPDAPAYDETDPDAPAYDEPEPDAPAYVEPAPAPPAYNEPESTPPAYVGPAPARGMSAAVIALLVTTVLMALATGAVWFMVLRETQERDALDKARTAALEASRDAARVLFSYDYRTLDKDFSAGRAVTTGPFQKEYAETTSKVVTNVAKESKAVVKAEVVTAGVARVSERTVVTIVYVNQVTTSSLAAGPKVDLSRVRMTLVKVGDDWRVSKVEAL